MVVVSSTDGFCSVIKFTADEIGTVYNDEDADLEPLEALEDADSEPLEPLDDSAIDGDDEVMDEGESDDDDLVPVSKDGIPLNKVLHINLTHKNLLSQ